ncbi:MAG: hypothetical protein ACKVIN_03040 [Longimicrobiales bacterium]
MAWNEPGVRVRQQCVDPAHDLVAPKDEDRVWEPHSGQLQIGLTVTDADRAAMPIAQRSLDARLADDAFMPTSGTTRLSTWK